MLRNVLSTRKTVSRQMSRTSWHFQVGMTIFSNFLILLKKTESTCPLPPFFTFLNYSLSLRESVADFLFIVKIVKWQVELLPSTYFRDVLILLTPLFLLLESFRLHVLLLRLLHLF